MSARLALTAAIATLAVITPTPASPAAGLGPAVCAGVSGCTVVAHVDVNGDGYKDAVGVAESPAGDQVIVRVKTATDNIVHRRTPLQSPSDDPWMGAARLDDHKGKDLVVFQASYTGNHLYNALAWRNGHLHLLAAPDGDAWQTTGNSGAMRGYKRTSSMPVGTIKVRRATPTSDPNVYDGQVTKYEFADGTWMATSGSDRSISSRRAIRWIGFDVPGLKQQ
jgi:hypothetical protein